MPPYYVQAKNALATAGLKACATPVPGRICKHTVITRRNGCDKASAARKFSGCFREAYVMHDPRARRQDMRGAKIGG